jgi:transposase
VVRVAFEPSGAYHHAFERRLAAVGLPLVKVNPRQARRFAEALGRHAKTDAGAAAMLARCAALLEPPVRPVLSATLDAMTELQVARRALVKDRVAARHRGHRHHLPLLKRPARSACARSSARSPRSTSPGTPSSPPIPSCRPASPSS